MKISVAMTVYNGARFLNEQLYSIESQTLRPHEIIICDDQSTDRSRDIVEEFSARSSMDVIIKCNDHRLGYSANFFKALSLCTGDVIFLCDQDDVWLPTKCETVIAKMRKSGAKLINHDFSVFFGDGKGDEIPSYFQWAEKQGYPARANIKGCSIALTRDFFATAGQPNDPITMPHDYYLCLAAELLGQRVLLSKPVMRHRIHGDNTSAYLLKSKNKVQSALKRMLFMPRSPQENLSYLLWKGTNIQNISDVERLCTRLLPSGEVTPTNAVIGSLRATLELSTMPRSGGIFRSKLALISAWLTGAYIGRGSLMAFAKDLLGRRDKLGKARK